MRSGQKRSRRIVYEIQNQTRIGNSVSERIQLLQCFDGLFENSVPSLRVRSSFFEIRKTGYYLDLLFRVELGKTSVFFSGKKNGEITTNHNLLIQLTKFGYEPSKLGIHLGRPAGQIHGRNRTGRKNAQTMKHRFLAHDLFSIGTRVHVTVFAGLIAEFSEIHLKNFGGNGTKSAHSRILQLVRKGRKILMKEYLLQYLKLSFGRNEFASSGL
ncbi:hypothetical protein LEP1GSC052_0795 [Leptospira kmetyi serovar Malaysia str. Bejo-Iso9]|nr:hypothetical protein LEP1GSC052_0795 [Leptospira kmetyi serovar Malaysia str. Bejo-Iso9]